MTGAIGIRLPNDILAKIGKLSREESEDRSTIIRKLLSAGYSDFIKKRAADKYREGKITISEAARQAEISIWEMETCLIRLGYKSEYSVDDIERELRRI